MFRKTFIPMAIIFAMLISAVPVTVSANTGPWDDDEGFRFEYVSGQMTIVDYRGTRRNITIPSRAPNNSWVDAIGERAFESAGLNSVTFASNSRIRTIGRRAFEDNNLNRITIPDHITSIGDDAFRDNPLREAHFDHMDGRDISLGSGVFSRVSNNFIITHAPRAQHFGRNWYPPHRTYSTDDAEVSEGDWRWTTLPGNNIMIIGFHEDSRLATAERIEIPERIGNRTVQSIQNRTFDDHPYLREVVIPSTIVTIYPRAFNNNRLLTSAFFRHSDGSGIDLSRDAFTGSHSNFTIFFPYGARGFTTPTWHGFRTQADNVEGIWETTPLGGGVELMITRYNGNATVVQIPATIEGRPVRYIGSETFRDNNTITEIIIPTSVVHIQANAVFTAPNLRVVRLRHSHADTIDVSGLAFTGVHADFTIIFPADATGFTTPTWVGFPAEPDLISAFWEYTTAGGNATITEYRGNEEIVEIPAYIGGSPVRVIATGAFRNNDDLERVIIPANVNTIETNAFHNNRNLYAAQLLHTNANQLTRFAQDSFVGNAPHFRLIYPVNATGFTTPLWNGYFAEPESDDLSLTYGRFEYIIRRDPIPGVANARRDVAVIVRFLGSDVDVEIPDTIQMIPVVGIGDFAFMQNQNITSVTIPSSVMSLGHSSFLGASNLARAYFRHASGEGITMHNSTFRYTASNFTIIYPPASTGFTTPTWNNWPARPDTAGPGAPGTPGTPGTPNIPGQGPDAPSAPRTFGLNSTFTTSDGSLRVAPVFVLVSNIENPSFDTSYVDARVVADLAGLQWASVPTAGMSYWDAGTQTVVFSDGDNTVSFRSGSQFANVNGVPTQIMAGNLRADARVLPNGGQQRMFVPVAFFNTLPFNVTIQWNQYTSPADRSITITPTR